MCFDESFNFLRPSESTSEMTFARLVILLVVTENTFNRIDQGKKSIANFGYLPALLYICGWAFQRDVYPVHNIIENFKTSELEVYFVWCADTRFAIFLWSPPVIEIVADAVVEA